MLQKLSNSELLNQTKKLALEERKLNIEILKHLKEIEVRKLFLEMGYRSLFEYTVKELSYSEDAAYRRINAMRLLKAVPQVEAKIQSGSLSLTAACKVQQFFKAEAIQNKPQTSSNKIELIESLENKSTREVEKELLRLNPEVIPTEKIRPLTEDKVELKIVIDEDLKNKLDRLKNLLSHVNPNMSYQELIGYLAEMGLKKLDPAQKITKSAHNTSEQQGLNTSTQEAHSQRNVSGSKRVNQPIQKSRYISSAVKYTVWMRDQGRCTFTDKVTGRRCSSNRRLQYDHIQPFSLGGEASVNNLRLFCQQHNRLRAEKTFGKWRVKLSQ